MIRTNKELGSYRLKLRVKLMKPKIESTQGVVK